MRTPIIPGKLGQPVIDWCVPATGVVTASLSPLPALFVDSSDMPAAVVPGAVVGSMQATGALVTIGAIDT